MAGKAQEYGKDYKTFCVLCTPAEHRRWRQLALDAGVSVGEVARRALNDEKHWRATAKVMARAKAAAKAREKAAK